MKKVALYGTVLIALYLAVDNATGSGAILAGGTNLAAGTIGAFQGRQVTASVVPK